MLTQLAASGDNFTNAFHVFLTYPFVDEVVGRDPQVARNLHMGDFTNLSITLEVDLSHRHHRAADAADQPAHGDRPHGDRRQRARVPRAAATLSSPACVKVLRPRTSLLQLKEECKKQANKDKDVCKQLNAVPGLPVPVPTTLPTIPIPTPTDAAAAADPDCRPCRDPGAPRAGSGQRRGPGGPTMGELMDVYDPDLVSLLDPGDGAPMITRRTKLQLLVFAIITLVGVTFVGARYARLDRVFVDDAYTVVAHFSDSGGAFAGAEVSYRGVRVGEVSEMVLTRDGVDIAPRHRQRAGHDPGRHARRGRQPVRRR